MVVKSFSTLSPRFLVNALGFEPNAQSADYHETQDFLTDFTSGDEALCTMKELLEGLGFGKGTCVATYQKLLRRETPYPKQSAKQGRRFIEEAKALYFLSVIPAEVLEENGKSTMSLDDWRVNMSMGLY
jgi:hypothetical protein